MEPDLLTTVRAAALFASRLSINDQPTLPQVSAAIRSAVRARGGTPACTAAYGDYPETAAARMRWALNVVKRAYVRQRRSAATVYAHEHSAQRGQPVINGPARAGSPASRTECQ